MFRRSQAVLKQYRKFSSEAYIVASCRTAVGSFQKSLASVEAPALGATVIRNLLDRSSVPAESVDEVYMGHVCQANCGQATTRQAALKGGLPNSVPCTAINKVCASGMKSISLAAQSIMLGHGNCIIAGGMESMSNIPYYIPKGRTGYGLGHGEFLDGLLKDGLTDSFDKHHMGMCGENTAKVQGFTREDQDNYAIESYRRAKAAAESGFFKNEIVPVLIPQRKGDPLAFDADEEWKVLKLDKVPSLRPVFKKDGTITAANASSINDGASGVMVVSEGFMKEHGLKPIAKIRSFADGACAPIDFPIAPAVACPKALNLAGLTVNDIDLFEVNEAFSVVALANMKLMNLPHEKTNVWGGAVSLGHPIGSSGSRIVVTMMSALQHYGKTLGLAGICNGGGGATALIIEMC